MSTTLDILIVLQIASTGATWQRLQPPHNSNKWLLLHRALMRAGAVLTPSNKA
jgi:hypothetical protein